MSNVIDIRMDSPKPKRRPMGSGTVTHPKDLQPAIDAMPDEAKTRLTFRCQGRKPTPKDIAETMDWYREEYADV